MNFPQIFFLPFILSSSIAEMIRCYCNLPECETTRNTCQFENGGCFSDFLDYLNITRARHGCLDLLPRSQQVLCGNAPGSTGAPRSLLLCCQLDMCNHLLSPSAQLTHSLIGSLINATERDIFTDGTHRPSAPNHEVWLKAATIAVPICGAMILTVLVILACRILRADHLHADHEATAKFASNAACPVNGPEAAKKVPLLAAEDLRTRIHCGQHVNILKERLADPGKIEKNVEYARVNLERGQDDPDDSDDTSSPLEVPSTVSPSFTLSLDKLENVNTCNLYESPSGGEMPSLLGEGRCSKIYEKNLL